MGSGSNNDVLRLGHGLGHGLGLSARLGLGLTLRLGLRPMLVLGSGSNLGSGSGTDSDIGPGSDSGVGSGSVRLRPLGGLHFGPSGLGLGLGSSGRASLWVEWSWGHLQCWTCPAYPPWAMVRVGVGRIFCMLFWDGTRDGLV